MSLSINNVIIGGNLTRDPETRVVGENTVAAFSIAINRRIKDRDEVLFIDCEAWRNTAEFVGKYLTKGAQVVVEGRLRQDNWEDKDGNKRSKIKVVAERVHSAGGKPANAVCGQCDCGDKPAAQSKTVAVEPAEEPPF